MNLFALSRRQAFAAAVILVGAWVNFASAAVSHASPEAFIRSLGEDVIEILADKGIGQPQRERRFHHMLQEYVDTNSISRTVLGRYWNVATPEQRTEFQRLYREYLIRIYATRFSKFNGEKFIVKGARPESESDSLVVSAIESPQGGPPYAVNWRVRKNGNGNFVVVDVMAEGVSLLVTHNQEFASVIQNKGGRVEGLLEELRKRSGPR